MRGLQVYPDNPFKFDFIIDQGDRTAAKDECARLIKYFLASLTTPESDMWVNLSPYEKERIVPKEFGGTEMGKELLAQDYLLKQVTSSIMYPEGAVGREFWKKIYAETYKRFGTSQVAVNSFNKVWIVPEKAAVYENKDTNSAMIVNSHLKVMMEEDYMALNKSKKAVTASENSDKTRQLSNQVIRKVILPVLEKEVNEGKNFMRLRQVYNSLILATWYKEKLKQTLISKGYVNRKKIGGVDVEDKNVSQEIYQRYLQSFKKGVYNYIKEEMGPDQQVVPRKYFSGGVSYYGIRSLVRDQAMTGQSGADRASQVLKKSLLRPLVVTAVLAASFSFMTPPAAAAQGAQAVQPDNNAVSVPVKKGNTVSGIVARNADVRDRIQALVQPNSKITFYTLKKADAIGILDRNGNLRSDKNLDLIRPGEKVVVDFNRMLSPQSADVAPRPLAEPAPARTVPVSAPASRVSTGTPLTTVAGDAPQPERGEPNPAVRLASATGTGASAGAPPPDPQTELGRLMAAMSKLEQDRARGHKSVEGYIKERSNLQSQIANASKLRAQQPTADQQRLQDIELIEDFSLKLGPQESGDFITQDNTYRAPVVVSYQPNAARMAFLQHQIDQKMRFAQAPQRSSSGAPLTGRVLTGYNRVDLSVGIGGGPTTFAFVPDLPFRELDNLARIAQGFANMGTQTALAKVAGPIFAADILMQLRNYVTMHPTRGQGRVYDVRKTDLEGIIHTLTVNVIPVISHDQTGNPVREQLVSMGLVDTVKAVFGSLDALLGDTGFFGNSQSRFPGWNGGFQREFGEYEQAFGFAADFNENPNRIFIRSYTVSDSTTRFRKNDRNGWEDVTPDMARDPRKDFYSATERGFILEYDPQTNQIRGREVYASPAFITERFAQSLQEAQTGQRASGNSHLTSTLVQGVRSVKELGDEQALLRGVTANGQKIWGVLRNPFSGRIDRFITNPQEINGMSQLKANGQSVRFVPGQAPAQPSALQNAGQIVAHYASDEITRVTGQVRDTVMGRRTAAQKFEGYDFSRRPEMQNVPPGLASLMKSNAQIFDPSGLLKAVNDAGQNNYGVIYFNDGRMPAVLTGTNNMRTIGTMAGAKGGVARASNGQYLLEGFPVPLDANTLVLVENGRAVGVIDPSDKLRQERIAQLDRTIATARVYDEGLANYGVSVDSKGNIRALTNAAREFVPARFAGEGVVGQKFGASKPTTITADTMVKVENVNGRPVVRAVLIPGQKLMAERRVVLETLASGGMEVEDQRNGRVVIYASGNDLTPAQVRAGIHPERELAELVLSGQAITVPTADGGHQRFLIQPEAPPSRLQELLRTEGPAGGPEEKRGDRGAPLPEGTLTTAVKDSIGAGISSGSDAVPRRFQVASLGSVPVPSSAMPPPVQLSTVNGPDGRPFHGISLDTQMFTAADIPALGRLGATGVRTYYPMPLNIAQRMVRDTQVKTLIVGIPLDGNAYGPATINSFWGTPVPNESARVSLEANNWVPYIRQLVDAVGGRAKVVIDLGNELNLAATYPTWKGKPDTEKTYRELFIMINDIAGRIKAEFGDAVQTTFTLGDRREHFVLALRLAPNIDVWGINYYRHNTSLRDDWNYAISVTGNSKPIYMAESGSHANLGERAQAETAMGDYRNAQAMGISIILMSSWLDNSMKRGEHEQSWGWFGPNGPRPVYMQMSQEWNKHAAPRQPQSAAQPAVTGRAPAATAPAPGAPAPTQLMLKNPATLAGINEHRVLVRWWSDNRAATYAEEAKKQLKMDWVPIADLNKLENILSRHAVEILKIDNQGNTVGRYVRMLGSGYVLWDAADIERQLRSHVLIVPNDGSGARFMPFQALKDPATHETIRRMSNNIQIIDTSGNAVARLSLNRNMAGSVVELLALNSSKVYELSGFDPFGISTPVGETTTRVDAQGLRHVTVVDLRPANNRLTIEDVYEERPDGSAVKLYSVRPLQQEIVYFRDGREHYSVSTNVDAEPGQTMMIDGRMVEHVTGIYNYNAQTQSGYHVNLRNLKRTGGFAPLRHTTFQDGQIKVDQKGFLRLAPGLTYDQVMESAAARGVLNSRDVYTYNSKGELDNRVVSVLNNGEWREAWTLRGGHIKPQPQLIGRLAQSNGVIAAALQRLGIDGDTVMIETIKTTPEGVTTYDYRIGGDILEKRIISIVRQGDTIISVSVGLEFDAMTGEQIYSYDLTQDFQVKSLSRTVDNDRSIQDLLPQNAGTTYAAFLAKHLGIQGADLWQDLESRGVSRDLIPQMVETIPFLLQTVNPNQGSYRVIEDKVRALEERYISANDAERSDILRQLADVVVDYHTTQNQAKYSNSRGDTTYRVLYPNNPLGQNIGNVYGPDAFGLDLWMLPQLNRFPVNVLPGSISMGRDGHLQRGMLYDSTSALTLNGPNGNYEANVNNYRIIGDQIALSVSYTNANQLVSEENRREVQRIANGALGSQYGGVITTHYDMRVPYPFPAYSTLNSDGRITGVMLHAVYTPGSGRQVVLMTNLEKSPTGGLHLRPKIQTQTLVNGNVVEGSKYEEDVSHYFMDALKSWQVYLAYPSLLVMLFSSGALIRGVRLAGVKKQLAQNAAKLAMETPDPPAEEKLKIDVEVPSWHTYGFSDAIAGSARESFQGRILAPVERGEPLEKVLGQWFHAYNRWRTAVMGIKEEFTPTIEDAWVLFLIINGSEMFNSNLTSGISYLFHKSLEARQANARTGDIAGFVRKEYLRWHAIMEVQQTTFQGLAGGAMKHVVPYDFYINTDDLRDMFNTREHVLWYDSLGYTVNGKKDARDAIYADFIEALKPKVADVKVALIKASERVSGDTMRTKRLAAGEKAYQAYVSFFQDIQDGKYALSEGFEFDGLTREGAMARLNGKPIIRKTFAENGASIGRLPTVLRPIRAIAQLVRNNYNGLLNPIALTASTGLAVTAYEGMLSWGSAAATAGLGYVAAKGFYYVLNFLLNRRINTKSFGEPTAPGVGYEKAKPTKSQKWYRAGFWSVTIGIKAAWDAYLLHYFLIPHREAIGATYQPFGPETVDLNPLLMLSMWSTSVIFLFMFTWAAVWLVSPFFSYIHGSLRGLGAIKNGKDLTEFQRDNRLKNLFVQKLLPGGGTGLSSARRDGAVDLITRTITDAHRVRDEVSDDEQILVNRAGHWDVFQAPDMQKNIAQAINGLTMDMPLMPKPENARTSTILSPVYVEDIILPLRDVNENKVIAKQGIAKIKNGAEILNRLINGGILEEVDDERVRILPDLDMKVDRVRAIAQGAFDDVMAVLQEHAIDTALDVMMNVGYTRLNYIISRNPQRWSNFIERMKRTGKADADELKRLTRLLTENGKLGAVNPELEMEIRLWGSYEGQPFARTLDGLMNIVRQYHVQFAVAHPEWSKEKIQEETNKKFQIVWAYQIWGDILNANENRPDFLLKKKDTEYLLRKYYQELGFIVDIASIQKRNGKAFKVLSRYDPTSDSIQDVWAIEMTEYNPIVGEGKSSNHLHATTFATREVVFTVDMNQDLDPLEAFKFNALLEEFNDPKVAGVNTPEVIFTSGFSRIGMFHNVADRTFNTATKRFKAQMGFADVHGHPDGYLASASFEAGGISAVPAISEDYKQGDELQFQGGKLLNREYMQFKKGRELSWVGTDGIFRKFAMGAAQYLLGRNAYLKNKHFGPIEGATDFYTGPSFFLVNTVAPIGFYLYILNVLILGVSSFAALPSPLVTWMMGVIMIGQALATNGFLQMALEEGPVKALKKFPVMLLTMAPFFIAHIFTYQAGFTAGVMGVAFYVATGRGFNLEHLGLSRIMKSFGKSHVILGTAGVALSLLGKHIWQNWTFWLSFNITLSCLFSAVIPFLLNPGTLPSKKISTRKVADMYTADIKSGAKLIKDTVWKEGIKKGDYRKAFIDGSTYAVVYAVWASVATLPAMPGLLAKIVRPQGSLIFEGAPDVEAGAAVADRALIAQPMAKSTQAAPGGIDLGKVHVDVSAPNGGVQIASDDPSMLRLLLNADGVTPIIYDIKPMTPRMIDRMVGAK